ncbi:DUF3906 family protein [Peribacillus sp. NPDC097675]|uniref:DUF3906 family protein n=1 Tax=Peribacillus sp. NPDC097675 TaxID=3390618 RepID=UPI003CFC465D
MNLYQFEVTINNELDHVIITADSEEMVAQFIEIDLEKHFFGNTLHYRRIVI